MVICVTQNGSVRLAQTDKPEIPEGYARPGEVAFVVSVLDVQAHHAHGVMHTPVDPGIHTTHGISGLVD